MNAGEVDYALVRLRCRLTARPTLDEWTRIRRIRALDAAWMALGQTGASLWMRSLTPDMPLPVLEAHLWSNWGGQLAQIAGWLPSAWQKALGRCAQPPAPASKGQDVRVQWAAGIVNALPPMAADEQLAVTQLCAQLGAHLRAFSGAPSGNGWPLREALQQRLQFVSALDPLSPVNIVRGVLLLALDFERLRGELVRRIGLRERAA